MEISPKKKWSTKENPISKTWKKMKSLGHMSRNKKNKTQIPCSSSLSSSSSSAPSFTKSRSWHCSSLQSDHREGPTNPKNRNDHRSTMVAPHGCFTVYVGPEKQRFVVKTKLANHPLFKILLEDAETEYGYRSEGPIVLPCEVDFFFKILAEMESLDEDEEDWNNLPVCGLCSPYRSSYSGAMESSVMKRYGSYKVLRTPQGFKLNSA